MIKETRKLDRTCFVRATCHHKNKEDFIEQEEWLAEVMKGAGFNIIFHPKYHSESNYNKTVWGRTKSFHRPICIYNYKDLKSEIPTTLSETLPVVWLEHW